MAISDPRCKYIYLTSVRENFDCDVYFPYKTLTDNYHLLTTESNVYEGLNYDDMLYCNHNQEEQTI